jgi:hypothetical protein
MNKEYRDITRKLVIDSFPVLKDKRILVLTGWLQFYAFSVWIPPFIRLIVLSNRAADLGVSAITGLIAHELCHQERYIKMGVAGYLGFAIKFLLSKETRSAEEKSTDRLTIEKGYGRNLYDLSVITHNDEKHKKINDYYLSIEEIKSYSESLGKWR